MAPCAPSRPHYARKAKQLDRAPRTSGPRDTRIGREQSCLGCFRERYVGGVVHSDVGTELPASWQQRQVPCSLHRKVRQVRQSQLCAPQIQGTNEDLLAKDRGHLQVDQLGRGEILTSQMSASEVSVRTVICQRDHQHAGVNDEHVPPECSQQPP